MTEMLTLNHEEERWYPTAIGVLDNHLKFFIAPNEYFSAQEAYPIKKNISYSLQYIEFLYRVMLDISMSSVIKKQNVKSFVVHGASVVEAIFNFLVIAEGHGNTSSWRKVNNIKTSEYELNGIKYKNDTNVMVKLDKPIKSQMTFDQLAKKVESEKLLGASFNSYSKIKPIRQLRNKIHIHDSDHLNDTDWNNFDNSEYELVSNVLFNVLTSEIFKGSNHYQRFDYLNVPNNTNQQSSSSGTRL
ncbi:MAG: hypothetical protein HRU05_03830 [Oceanospirillaceae bacterium]|nr:hypothetical protein [Oceanospirillaceae bacterium]